MVISKIVSTLLMVWILSDMFVFMELQLEGELRRILKTRKLALIIILLTPFLSTYLMIKTFNNT